MSLWVVRVCVSVAVGCWGLCQCQCHCGLFGFVSVSLWVVRVCASVGVPILSQHDACYNPDMSKIISNVL